MTIASRTRATASVARTCRAGNHSSPWHAFASVLAEQIKAELPEAKVSVIGRGNGYWNPIFVDSLREEAKLHTVGALLIRDDLINSFQPGVPVCIVVHGSFVGTAAQPHMCLQKLQVGVIVLFPGDHVT